jgi:hypothetical protein
MYLKFFLALTQTWRYTVPGLRNPSCNPHRHLHLTRGRSQATKPVGVGPTSRIIRHFSHGPQRIPGNSVPKGNGFNGLEECQQEIWDCEEKTSSKEVMGEYVPGFLVMEHCLFIDYCPIKSSIHRGHLDDCQRLASIMLVF